MKLAWELKTNFTKSQYIITHYYYCFNALCYCSWGLQCPKAALKLIFIIFFISQLLQKYENWELLRAAAASSQNLL